MIISKENFREYIKDLRYSWLFKNSLYELGIDLKTSIIDGFKGPLVDTIFTKKQKNEIEWWLYDSPNGIEGDDKVKHLAATITWRNAKTKDIEKEFTIRDPDDLYKWLEMLENEDL